MWDIRYSPASLLLSPENRPYTYLELQEPATSPPTTTMHLTHPLLPWWIEVTSHSAPGSIISISHLLTQVYYELQRQVMESDYWNEGMSEEDRRLIDRAWRHRCAGDIEEARRGIRRVDFLLDEFIFMGITKRGEGEWELKIKRRPMTAKGR